MSNKKWNLLMVRCKKSFAMWASELRLTLVVILLSATNPDDEFRNNATTTATFENVDIVVGSLFGSYCNAS